MKKNFIEKKSEFKCDRILKRTQLFLPFMLRFMLQYVIYQR